MIYIMLHASNHMVCSKKLSDNPETNGFAMDLYSLDKYFLFTWHSLDKHNYGQITSDSIEKEFFCFS